MWKRRLARFASPWSWFSRVYVFLFRRGSPVKSEIREPLAVHLKDPQKQLDCTFREIPSSSAPKSLSEVPQVKPDPVSSDSAVGSGVTMNRTPVALAMQARMPLIKFIGPRLPRPHFDRALLPPLASLTVHSESAPSDMASTAPGESVSSIGPVGKIPRGQGIPFSELPARFRRQPISEEECAAINNGGAYGL